ncbi:cytochrome c-type biogenesis protein [Desulfosalsimonas propionicica]|uniref:Cytochrome c-type biogenesis protein n=1 Tax=Desulfosalsimonas propionicica TaxID=332175 RepID=A0A7W0HLE1_9BACT|nr:cytochrome c biogenesis protein CcdA [Desulfosalsimonas propionicica]MBA2881886.1 cytochrome c-type biogenesis protein [Desulfosalsimonas propionicica]
MFDQFLITVNQMMSGGLAVAGVGAFAWGMISVLFSPCHLASIPLIVAYVGGQQSAVNPKRAGWYAGAFSLGLFITIAAVGIICAMLGRMLGDVGIWLQVAVGGVLIWVALGMMGVQACTMSGGLLYRLNLRGIHGAFGLGLAYGILSGSCTFGFIAPILAIVTVQQEIFAGSVMMLLFALGHCLPIVFAGSSAAAVRRLTESAAWQGAGTWFRKGAGAVIGLLGVYFMAGPFTGVI